MPSVLGRRSTTGTLLVSVCGACGHRWLPPLATCPRCASRDVTQRAGGAVGRALLLDGDPPARPTRRTPRRRRTPSASSSSTTARRLYGRIVGVDHDDLRDGLRLRRARSRKVDGAPIWYFATERSDDRRRSGRSSTSPTAGGTARRSPRTCPRARAATNPTRSRSSTRPPTHASPTAELWDDACRGRGVPRRRTACRPRRRRVGPAPQLVRDGGRRPRRARARRGAQPAAPELPRARARTTSCGTARSKLLFTPDEFRGFDHAAHGTRAARRRSTRSSTTSSSAGAATFGDRRARRMRATHVEPSSIPARSPR